MALKLVDAMKIKYPAWFDKMIDSDPFQSADEAPEAGLGNLAQIAAHRQQLHPTGCPWHGVLCRGAPLQGEDDTQHALRNQDH